MKKWIVILTAVFLLQGCSQKSQEEVIQEYIGNAEAFYKNNDYYAAADWMDSAIDEAIEEYGEESARVAELYLRKAELTDIFEYAMEAIRCSEMIYENLDDKKGMARVYYNYGDCHDRMGQYQQAIEYYKKAVEYCNDAGEEMKDLQFDACLHWGLCEDEPENRLELLQEAEELFDTLSLEKQKTDGIRLYYGIGYVYDDLEQFEQTIKYCTKAIECYNEDKNRIQTLIASYHLRGSANLGLGNTEQAIEDTIRAKELLETREPDMGLWEKAIIYLKLAIAFSKTPDYDKVLEYGLAACRIYTEQKELNDEELQELKTAKEVFEMLYENTPYAKQQDFETWYQENISKYTTS